MMNWPEWAGDLLRFSFHSATAYLGFMVGDTTKPSFIKYFAYFLGLGQLLAAALDAASLLERMEGKGPDQTQIPHANPFPVWPEKNP